MCVWVEVVSFDFGIVISVGVGLVRFWGVVVEVDGVIVMWVRGVVCVIGIVVNLRLIGWVWVREF